MGIFKKANNIYITVRDTYTSISGSSYEEAEEVIIEATNGNLELVSQKKLVMQGLGNGKGDDKSKKTQLLVTKVEGKNTAIPYEKVTYKVTKYNQDKVSENDKKRIQWAIKIDGEQEILKEKGEKLVLTIKDEWAAKEIIVMPFLVKPNEEKVSKITRVDFCRYVDVKTIIKYICKEIKTNFNHKDTLFMKYLNDNISLKNDIKINIAYKLSAYEKWKDLVAKGKIWDHKKEIRKLQNDKNWSCSKFDKYTIKFYFDIWSNIHYGFIGKRAGFSEFELINGAGYAQIGDNGKKLSEWKVWKEYLKNRFIDFGDCDILGGFDDPNDTQAIKIGFRLYDKFKNSMHLLTEETIMEEVLETYKSEKPLSIERCEYHSYY